MVTRGKVHQAASLPGALATRGSKPCGVVTWHIDGPACEIVTLNALQRYSGIGTALLNAARSAALGAGCARLWLITTNDNINALRFYQKRGFQLIAAHCNAVACSRLLKPSIPLIGDFGIPIRDEIEFEMDLGMGAR